MPNEDPNGVVETWQINTKDDQSRCTGTCTPVKFFLEFVSSEIYGQADWLCESTG